MILATQGVVAGAVRDGETGAPLAGAVVVLADMDRAARTDADGRYLLADVPAGRHEISVRFLGYAPRAVRALVPAEGRLEINISLRATPISLQPFDVSAEDPTNGETAVFPDRGTSAAALWSHPLLAEPDALQALASADVALQAETPNGVHIRGGASDQTSYLLDDIPVFSPYHAPGVFSAWSPDALAGIALWSTASPRFIGTLSGAVAGMTRAPSPKFHAQGGVSTTQTRVTADGPIGAAGGGYLISVRSSPPGVVAPLDETSYVLGEAGDVLAVVEAPALGGRVRLLGYDNQNESATAAIANGAGAGQRNTFEWSSRSVGAEWRRDVENTTLRLVAWRATGRAGSAWAALDAPVTLGSTRADDGFLATLAHTALHGVTTAVVRLERSRTRYRVAADSGGGSWSIDARTPVATAFARHAHALSDRVELTLAGAVAAAGRRAYVEPQGQLRWTTPRFTLVASYAGTHQFAQSLRNPESVVGNVFPVDLYVGAAAPGVPVARGTQGVLAADYRPVDGVRLGVQAYARESRGLVLVAPRSGEPFATAGFVTGSEAARGLSLDAAVSAAHYGVIASYGLQRARFRYGDSSYVPGHSPAQVFEGGVIVFPTATSSIRLSVTGAMGRRATMVTNGFEWEACNLLDRGCELAGSPRYEGEALGGTPLPSYVRVDVGARKHWRLTVAGRDAVVALFGTVTNVLGRKNVLTYTRDPVTGRPLPVEMRPLAPLVVGLDWRF